MGNGIAVQFAQAVHRFLQSSLRRERHAVPTFPDRRVPQTEIGRQIHHAHALFQQGGRIAHGDTVRRGKKYHVAFGKRRIFRCGKTQIINATQAGEIIRNVHAGLAAASDGAYFGMRVVRQQAQQFDTRIAGGPDNADFKGGVGHIQGYP